MNAPPMSLLINVENDYNHPHPWSSSNIGEYLAMRKYYFIGIFTQNSQSHRMQPNLASCYFGSKVFPNRMYQKVYTHGMS
jgi:hypothetical protein